jgi:hypothetical protein
MNSAVTIVHDILLTITVITICVTVWQVTPRLSRLGRRRRPPG